MDSRSLARFRTLALSALSAGAAGSVGLTLYAGRGNSFRLLTAIFVVWVLSPFGALLFADKVSKSWAAAARATLYIVMFIIACGSLMAYTLRVLRPPRAQAAFVFVMFPPASWAFIAIVVGAAMIVSRRQNRPA